MLDDSRRGNMDDMRLLGVGVWVGEPPGHSAGTWRRLMRREPLRLVCLA